METLVFGDAVGDGGSWSRPARYAGIHWARNFSLRPGFIAMPMPSLSGMTSGLTGEVHIETQAKRQAVGVDFVAVLGTFATAEVAVATSRSDHIQGNHYLFGLERRTSRGYGALRWGYFDRDFVQFAAVPNELRLRERLSVGLGALLQGNISTAINYTAQTSWEKDRVDLVSVNLGVTLPEGIYLSSYVSQDLAADNGWSAGITFNLPLGRQRTANTSSSFNHKRNPINRTEVSQSVPGGLGSGWRLGISDDRNQRWRAGLNHNSSRGSIRAEATDTVNAALRFRASRKLPYPLHAVVCLLIFQYILLAMRWCCFACLMIAKGAQASNCQVSATAVSFGSFSPLSLNVAGYSIVLSAGNGSYRVRSMVSGSNTLDYNLYRDAAHQQVWGDGSSADNYSVTAVNPVNGQNYIHAVYGRIPLITKRGTHVGIYSDSIAVVVNY